MERVLEEGEARRPATGTARTPVEVTLLIPCLNERGTLGATAAEGLAALDRLQVSGEVLVADNGSTDGSPEIARAAGARVVAAHPRGYGAAIRAGIAAARGRYVVMADADGTYKFAEIGPFLDRLRNGADLVLGTRLPPGTILPGANPWLHRRVGTPALTFVLNRLYGTTIHDCNCGMRAFTKTAALDLGLTCDGMELASEMIARAALRGLRIDEVPITLHPDVRERVPHLRPWRDGWRHLSFLIRHRLQA